MSHPKKKDVHEGHARNLFAQRHFFFSPRRHISKNAGSPAMAINAAVISLSDPGAVPGASTKCPSQIPVQKISDGARNAGI